MRSNSIAKTAHHGFLETCLEENSGTSYLERLWGCYRNFVVDVYLLRRLSDHSPSRWKKIQVRIEMFVNEASVCQPLWLAESERSSGLP